jgi:hypothetical protein
VGWEPGAKELEQLRALLIRLGAVVAAQPPGIQPS